MTLTYTEIENRLRENSLAQGYVIGDYLLTKITFYQTELSGDCLIKATKEMRLIETAVDSESVIATDSNSDIAYAYKEGVVIDNA